MTLQEKIQSDLKKSIKAKDGTVDTMRVLLGELQRQPTKELTDRQVLKVINTLIKSEMETLEKKGESTDTDYIKVLESYTPREATINEIRTWISANIAFERFRNRNEIMRPVMAHFGTRADGRIVRQILKDWVINRTNR